MRTFTFTCCALIVSAAALAGCGSPVPGGAPGATPPLATSQSRSQIAQTAHHNVVSDPSFEKPIISPGSYEAFAPGQKIGPWKVVGPGGEVGMVSTTYVAGGYTFNAGCGKQSVDLSDGGAKDGVSQKLRTRIGKRALSFMIGNIYGPTYFGKKSTVVVFVDGREIFKATNSKGKGVKHLVWEKFSTSFNAKSTSLTITFKSGDSTYDLVDELDCVVVK